MNNFPHSTLRAVEATPRLTPEHAKEVCELIEKLGKVQSSSSFPQRPAICVAVFTTSLVKWLVNDEEATATIDSLKVGITKASSR